MAKPKIVIADDEADILSLLVTTFTARGYDVIGASNGEIALELIEKERPDAVLLDFMMPYLDGITVCERARVSQPDLYVIIMSGIGSDRLRQYSKNTRIDEYVEKPIRMSVLADKVKEGLAQRAKLTN